MNILIADHFDTSIQAQLDSLKGVQGVKVSQEPFPTPTESSDIDILICRSRTKVNEKLLRQSPQLKLVVTCTSGFDHLDLELLKSKNILACYTPEANVISAAEHTLWLMLSTLRFSRKAQQELDNGKWRQQLKRSDELNEKTLGLIGLGRVGRRVSQFANSFGAKVIAYDPFVDDDVFSNYQVERYALSELLKMSDIISLHVPLTKWTSQMINQQTIDLMATDAILINASRGQVVNEVDLIMALKNGNLNSAGLDVFEKEPLDKESDLRNLPQVVLSQHLGGFSEQALLRASQSAIREVEAFIAKRPLSNPLPECVWWWNKKP